MAALHLWVVRHGQTVFNLENRWQGWADSPLTEEGQRQAVEVAERLRGLPFDELVVSTLGRARQTLDIIVEHLGLETVPVRTEDRVKERGVGVLSGVLTKDMASLFPNEVQMRLEDPLNWHPENGESSWAFIERVRGFAQDLAAEQGSEARRILLVTHGGVCAQLHSFALGEEPIYSWELKIPNAAISQYVFDAGQWSCAQSDITLRDNSMTWFPS